MRKFRKKNLCLQTKISLKKSQMQVYFPVYNLFPRLLPKGFTTPSRSRICMFRCILLILQSLRAGSLRTAGQFL